MPALDLLQPLTDDKICHSSAQVAIVTELEKGRRRQHTALGMFPAQQRLDAIDVPAVGKAFQNGLIVDDELTVIDRSGEILLS